MQLAAELLKGLYYLYYSFQHPATPVLLAGLMAMIAAYAVRFRSNILRFNLNSLSYSLFNFEVSCPVESSVAVTR